jgi:hypothetical protein
MQQYAFRMKHYGTVNTVAQTIGRRFNVPVLTEFARPRVEKRVLARLR